MLKHVKDRFDITIPKSLPITFIHIPPMTLATTKRFTLVVESLHSIKIAYNALCQFTPHMYIDTTGCAFTFIVAKLLANCKVIAYVHYPTISTVSHSGIVKKYRNYFMIMMEKTNPNFHIAILCHSS